MILSSLSLCRERDITEAEQKPQVAKANWEGAGVEQSQGTQQSVSAASLDGFMADPQMAASALPTKCILIPVKSSQGWKAAVKTQ
jgi:hypothetical protein